jgi:hypothetical protein
VNVKGVGGDSYAERFSQFRPHRHQLGHVGFRFEIETGLSSLGFQHPLADELLDSRQRYMLLCIAGISPAIRGRDALATT